MDICSKIQSLGPMLQDEEPQPKAVLCQINKSSNAVGSQKTRHGLLTQHYIRPDAWFLSYSCLTLD